MKTPTSLRHQSGAATLAVVMILFFIIALVAAYTSRNLIFEQRTSANQYRSTQAFEAAEAGLEWALAQLNAGRMDETCSPTNDTSFSTFRARYIDAINSEGVVSIKYRSATAGTPAVPLPLLPVCVFDAVTQTWSCNCPIDEASVRPTVTGTAARPMFRLKLEYPIGYNPAAGAMALRLVAVGCTRPDDNCMRDDGSSAAPAGDAMAVLTGMVAMKGALSTLPGASVVARGSVAGGGALVAVNTQVSTAGNTVMSGSAIGGVVANTLPGSPSGQSLVANDASLAALNSGDRFFAAFLGMWPSMYEAQPGLIRLPCTTAACTSADVTAAVTANPGHAVWIDGDLNVDGNIGSAPGATSLVGAEVPTVAPVLLIATGQVTLSSGTVYGVIYSRAASWDRGAGSTTVRGALVAEGNLTGTGAQTVVYDPEVLAWLRTRTGTLVRVPGGWKDFADAP